MDNVGIGVFIVSMIRTYSWVAGDLRNLDAHVTSLWWLVKIKSSQYSSYGRGVILVAVIKNWLDTL